VGDVGPPRVGVVGLGSIGQRHAHELNDAGAEVLALRRRVSLSAGREGDAWSVKQLSDASAFWGSGLDAVVIANPTSLHAASLVTALNETDAVVLVEKPVLASAADAQAIPTRWRDRVRVGYCLRFHPVIRAVKRAVDGGEVGQVLSGEIRFGSSLPDWQPGRDYRESYAARRDLGGGVLRTLSHELDLVQHLAGAVTGVAGLIGHVSPLEIDVEDVAQLTLRTASGGMIAVNIDYFTPGYVRNGSLVGTEGRIEYSLNPGACFAEVTGADGGQRSVVSEDATDMYAAQALDLLGWASGSPSAACTFAEGIQILKVIETAEGLPQHGVDA
jgi:predicted dehydrogenase